MERSYTLLLTELLQHEKQEALEISRAVENKSEELGIRQATVGILGEATARLG